MRFKPFSKSRLVPILKYVITPRSDINWTVKKMTKKENDRSGDMNNSSSEKVMQRWPYTPDYDLKSLLWSVFVGANKW